MLASLLLALCTSGASLACSAPVSGAAYLPDQVIVKFAATATPDARRAARRQAGVTQILGRVSVNGAQVVEVRGDAREAARELDRLPAVDYAEPDLIVRATSVPNDPRFDELYGLDNPSDTDIDAPEGWDRAFGAGNFPTSPGVRLAIIDTGIDAGHEDLAGRRVACAGVRSFGIIGGADPTIVDGRCTDDQDHGTHVAGTVAATANNGRGVAGVAPPAQLAICKALDANGSGSLSGIANCIDWAVGEDARVISMSLGGPGSSETLRDAVRRAWDGGDGAVVVAAAGNDGDSTVNFPAGFDEVIAVAATDARDRRAPFSNANADVELSAAGVDVLSTRRGGGYVTLSGTSMATPHVAGVAAVIAFRFPNLDAAGIRDRMTSNADPLGPPGRDPSFGFGRVNLAAALG